MTSPIRFTPRNSTRLAEELQPYLRLPLLPPVTEAATVCHPRNLVAPCVGAEPLHIRFTGGT